MESAKFEGKAALRKRLKRERAALPADERAACDAAIAEALFALPQWREAQVVFAYRSFGPEVDTEAIVRRAWDEGKRVVLPRVLAGTRQMTWHEVRSFEGLECSALGVEEPPADESTRVDAAAVAGSCGADALLTLVPALAFDAHGYRLGYGGGFYDAFLASFPGVSAGLCRRAFFLDELPCTEPHDLPTHLVVTDAGAVAVAG